jgi:DNA repair protein RecN (Recombination protein N)
VLRELQVKNLAVLAEARVAFGPGLNVLSGETGAGKSIVVDSLALLAGARASADLILCYPAQVTFKGHPKIFDMAVVRKAKVWHKI